jgi:hypothetical protein
VYTFVVVLAFLLTGGLLALYDYTVRKRQEKTMKSALRSTAIVSSLFPEQVRDRLLRDAEAEERQQAAGSGGGGGGGARRRRHRNKKNSAFVNKDHSYSAGGGTGENSSLAASAKSQAIAGK